MMKSNNLMLIFSVIMVIVVIINISVVFIKMSVIKNELTGQASGLVNVSILSTISINMSRDIINWSAGSINSGELNATLYTSGENAIVLRGNWSVSGVKGFVLKNIGGSNVSIFLKSDKNATSFFGGSESQQAYKWNVSNKEAGSCNGQLIGQWADVNTSIGGTRFCTQFDFHETNNEIYIDLLFTVPSDAAYLGDLSDTITIIAQPAS